MIEDLEVYAQWPALGLVAELDSWGFHRTRADQQADRERSRRLTLAGLRLLRFTYADVTQRGPEVIRDLRRAGVRRTAASGARRRTGSRRRSPAGRG